MVLYKSGGPSPLSYARGDDDLTSPCAGDECCETKPISNQSFELKTIIFVILVGSVSYYFTPDLFLWSENHYWLENAFQK